MSPTKTATAGFIVMSLAAACSDGPMVRAARSNAAQPSAAPSAAAGNPMTEGLARVALRDVLQKRHLYQRKAAMPDLFEDQVEGTSYYEVKNLRITRDSVAFDYDEDRTFYKNPAWNTSQDTKRKSTHVDYRFSTQGFCTGVRRFEDARGGYFGPGGFDNAPKGLFAWEDSRDAQHFCNAWNRLVYEARRGNSDDMLVFSSLARTWRERPESRTAAPAGWDRERILAEQSYRERDIGAAIEHFEAGLRMNPMWPEGWFNAALLYEVVGDYDFAANRMRHYLELVPNAPDSRAAREKLIFWEEKARRQ